jgi:hypothetical protein
VWIDRDVLAGRCDRAGRAKVETTAAARQAVALMGTLPFFQRYVSRTIKITGKLASLAYDLFDRSWIAWVCSQVAIAKAIGGEEGRASAEVNDEIACRFGPFRASSKTSLARDEGKGGAKSSTTRLKAPK